MTAWQIALNLINPQKTVVYGRCPHCGKKFVVAPNKKYCGEGCTRQARYMREKLK